MTPGWMHLLGALAAVALSALQWALHRRMQREALDGAEKRHLQQLQGVNRKLERTAREIAHLRQQLAAARLELKRRDDKAAAAPSELALLRELEAAESTYAPRSDGFADTLPSAQYAHAQEWVARTQGAKGAAARTGRTRAGTSLG